MLNYETPNFPKFAKELVQKKYRIDEKYYLAFCNTRGISTKNIPENAKYVEKCINDVLVLGFNCVVFFIQIDAAFSENIKIIDLD